MSFSSWSCFVMQTCSSALRLMYFWPSSTSVVPWFRRRQRIETIAPESMMIGRNESECGQMGVTDRTSRPGEMIGPPAERLYAVEPEGVAMMTPSPENFVVPELYGPGAIDSSRSIILYGGPLVITASFSASDS